LDISSDLKNKKYKQMKKTFFVLVFFVSFALSAKEAQYSLNEIDCSGMCGPFTDKDSDGFCDFGIITQQKLSEYPQKEVQKKPYHIFPISIALVVLYAISLMLMKVKVYRKITHRKIWNIALTITFLTSSGLGIMLVVFIQNQTLPENYLHLLKYHVNFGIAMTVISIFHISWHLNFFKTIFKKTH